MATAAIRLDPQDKRSWDWACCKPTPTVSHSAMPCSPLQLRHVIAPTRRSLVGASLGLGAPLEEGRMRISSRGGVTERAGQAASAAFARTPLRGRDGGQLRLAATRTWLQPHLPADGSLPTFKTGRGRRVGCQGTLLAFVVDDLDGSSPGSPRPGAQVVTAPETEPWGERYCQFADANGLVWQLVQWVDAPAWSEPPGLRLELTYPYDGRHRVADGCQRAGPGVVGARQRVGEVEVERTSRSPSPGWAP